MAEFIITDGNVYFKEGNMVNYSHFGPEYISEPTETENQYEIKKFSLAEGQYVHTNELTDWMGNAVTDGYYTLVPEVIPQVYAPTNAQVAQMISDLQADLLIAGVI